MTELSRDEYRQEVYQDFISHVLNVFPKFVENLKKETADPNASTVDVLFKYIRANHGSYRSQLETNEQFKNKLEKSFRAMERVANGDTTGHKDLLELCVHMFLFMDLEDNSCEISKNYDHTNIKIYVPVLWKTNRLQEEHLQASLNVINNSTSTRRGMLDNRDLRNIFSSIVLEDKSGLPLEKLSELYRMSIQIICRNIFVPSGAAGNFNSIKSKESQEDFLCRTTEIFVKAELDGSLATFRMEDGNCLIMPDVFVALFLSQGYLDRDSALLFSRFHKTVYWQNNNHVVFKDKVPIPKEFRNFNKDMMMSTFFRNYGPIFLDLFFNSFDELKGSKEIGGAIPEEWWFSAFMPGMRDLYNVTKKEAPRYKELVSNGCLSVLDHSDDPWDPKELEVKVLPKKFTIPRIYLKENS